MPALRLPVAGVMLLGLLAVLQVRGDGWFPFPRTTAPALMQVMVLAELALLAWCVVRGGRELARPDGGRGPTRPLPAVLLPLLLTAELTVAGCLQWLQARHFAAVGYRLQPLLLAGLTLAAIAMVWLGYARSARGSRPGVLIGWLLGALLAAKLIPLILFPLTPLKSDMLPVLLAAGGDLLHGISPYHVHLLADGVAGYTPRLPGLIAFYLPAVLLHADPRWLTLGCELLLLALLMRRAGRDPGLLLLVAAFWFLPYWLVRHDLYESPFWLLLVLAWRPATAGGKWQLPAMLALGLTHQWGILIDAYLLILLARRVGWRRALATGEVLALVGLLGLYAVAHGDWSGPVQHLLGVYATTDLLPTMLHLNYLLDWLTLGGAALPLQLLLQAGLYAAAVRRVHTPAALAGALAIALTLLLLLNPVAWTYQYLFVGLLLLLGLLDQRAAV
ncbi:MAG TPA: hypothetical protein PKM88_10750 [bacterium]|nr:hypothetical protein [bacterium]